MQTLSAQNINIFTPVSPPSLTLQVRWTKTAGSASDKFQETSIYNETLRIEGIQRVQGGRYYCKADNGVGVAAIKSIRVDVQCKWARAKQVRSRNHRWRPLSPFPPLARESKRLGERWKDWRRGRWKTDWMCDDISGGNGFRGVSDGGQNHGLGIKPRRDDVFGNGGR